MQDDKHKRRSARLGRIRLEFVAAAVIIMYVVFVQYFLGWLAIFKDWSVLGFHNVFAVVSLFVGTYFVRAWRMFDYFKGESSGRYLELFHVSQVHNLLNMMLPFRSGEASFPLLMRSEFSVPLPRGTSALLVMRLLDLHALLAFGGLGVVLASSSMVWSGAGWALFLVAPIPAFLGKEVVVSLLRPRLNGRLGRVFSDIIDGLPTDVSSLFRAWCATVINWGVKVLVFAWALSLMGVVPLAACFGGALGGELSSVLPFHAPAGVGTYPAAIVAGSVALGAGATQPATDVLIRASISLHIMLVTSALLGAVLSTVLSSSIRKSVYPSGD